MKATGDLSLATVLKAVHQATRSAEQRASPLEIVSHFLLPVVLILAISQSLTMKDITEEVHRFQQPLVEHARKTRLENLLRRVELVCQETEQEWGLKLFVRRRPNERSELVVEPLIERVRWLKDVPADDAFSHLCRRASSLATSPRTDDLVRNLYKRVLARSVGDLPRLYDPAFLDEDRKWVPPNTPEDVLVSQDERQVVLAQLRQRCSEWQNQVVAIQGEVVLKYAEANVNPDSKDTLNDVAARTARELKALGYPMLPESTGQSP